MNMLIGRLVELLIVAVIVAIAARRLHLPYTAGLVLAGLGVAILGITLGVPLTHDVIFDVILPPLLFEAALNLRWRELLNDWLPIFALSILGVIVSAGVVLVGLRWLAGWTIDSALIFGVLIAATDPIAVIALFKDNGIGGRLRLLVESESLFNDGVAAVFFALALTWAGSHAVGFWGGLTAVLVSSCGGIAIGLLVGMVALILAGRVNDHLVETAVTAAAAYAAFLLADRMEVSGVLATVSAGLLIGTFGVRQTRWHLGLSEEGRAFVLKVWDFMAFLANSFVFILIGLSIARVPFASLGYGVLVSAIAAVLVGRAVTVYPIAFMFQATRWRIPIVDQHVLWWGGLRGALALALALSLPPSLPNRERIIVATFAVVAFSVICQGLTMPLLLRRLLLLRQDS